MKSYADWRVGAQSAERRNYDHRIILTFDDSGTPRQVKRLLKILSLHEVRAVFFVLASWAQEYPELIEKIREAGHIVGDHTYSHPDLLTLTDDEIRAEIGRLDGCFWLRPPMGRYNDRIRRLASEANLEIKYWTIDSDDWQGVPASYISKKILQQVHPGAVILFHIHADQTAEALPDLIQEIRARGYELASSGQPIWGQK